MARKRKFGDGGYNAMFTDRSLADKYNGPSTPVVEDTSGIDQSADKAANAALAARQRAPAARPVIAQAARDATVPPVTPKTAAAPAATSDAERIRRWENEGQQNARVNKMMGFTRPTPAKTTPTKTAPSKGRDSSSAGARDRMDKIVRPIAKTTAAVLSPSYGAYKVAQAAARSSGRDSQRKPTSTLPDSSNQPVPTAFRNADRGTKYITKNAKGGRIKMATGGDTNLDSDTNFDSDAATINKRASEDIGGPKFTSNAVVQDTSKMDTSADDAANAKLAARSKPKGAASTSKGTKPARSFGANTPAPVKKAASTSSSSSSSSPDRLSAYRSAAAARGASAPETKGADITVTAPRGTRAANAAAATQKSKLADAKTRAAGYYAQGRANVAKAQGMSERDKAQAAVKRVRGYASGGKVAPAPPKQSGAAKAANSSLGRETLNPAKAVARGNRDPVEKMPPKGAASTSLYAKGGSIDGCAKRGRTRCKGSR